MKAALVLNDRAGALLRNQSGGNELCASLQAAGFDIVPIAPGNLPDRLAQARDCGADLVVAGGGDGTVACAAQELAGSDQVLGILPAGTANLLAKDLGIPVGAPDEAIRIMQAGEVRAIDVGFIGEHAFLCAVMFGSPARLGHHRELGREHGNGVTGWLRLALAFLRAARRHRAHHYEINVDGVHHMLRTAALTVTVNALADHATRLFGRMCLDGGELCVYALRPRSVFALARLAANVLRGHVTEDAAITVLRGQELQISRRSGSLRVLVDGEERLLQSPVYITLMPRALKVMAARPA
jgi:diacylglycerol kinase family enzyme